MKARNSPFHLCGEYTAEPVWEGEKGVGEPILHFNLACYECQLGELEVAKARLAHAFKLEPKCRLMALDDDDLAPLWDSLAV